MEQDLTTILKEIDKKSIAIKNLGKQLNKISQSLYLFDVYLIATLNRTINLNKGFTSLIRDNNFIAAAPLVRLNLDSLLRLYAARISEFDKNTFANKVLGGESIRKIRSNSKKAKLTDSYLVKSLSQHEGYEWVSKIYEAGNLYVHLSNKIMFSSQRVDVKDERKITLTIGFHDFFIPEDEKYGAAVWMDKINDSIVTQTQIWFYEKAKLCGFDLNDLNYPA